MIFKTKVASLFSYYSTRWRYFSIVICNALEIRIYFLVLNIDLDTNI